MKLDIGCGEFKREGYTGVDPYIETDIQAFMWALPLPDDSVEEIYTSHALEHVSKFEVPLALVEWKRVIIAGGLIEIQVPDLKWCCEQWLARQSTDWYMDILFGQQIHAGEFHKTGFTLPIMQRYLDEVGLILADYKVIESHGQPTLDFFVTKE